MHRPGRLDTRTPRRRTPNSARTPQSSENASLATQNRPGGQSPRTSGLREDSAKIGECSPGPTEWPWCPEPMDLRTPRGLREVRKMLPWPHRIALVPRAHGPQDSARTPRCSPSAGLATQHGPPPPPSNRTGIGHCLIQTVARSRYDLATGGFWGLGVHGAGLSVAPALTPSSAAPYCPAVSVPARLSFA